ncbi:MAG: type II secretion system protein [Burkholderiales bacterium]|nr:type II secretion system protein [Burkholderiales bacterium]
MPRAACRALSGGFAYLWLLFAVAFLGAGLAAAGTVWEVRVRREKEADLLAIGAEMRRAIGAYHRATPQAAKELPQKLEDLVEDRRGAAPRRHLRRIYPDPLTGRAEWGLILVEGRIHGVFSLARGTPVRRGGFAEADQAFANARTYAAWRFVANDVIVAPAQPAAGAPPATAPGATPGPAAAAPRGASAAAPAGALPATARAAAGTAAQPAQPGTATATADGVAADVPAPADARLPDNLTPPPPAR